MENRDALVSIIVPVYGTETYLPACIDSLCKQSYPNIQIILVDDQSPDGCPEICDRYAKEDSRIIVIHQKNTGVSGARNAGIRRATGDYIMFVDSDDALYPDAVKILMQDAQDFNADIASAPPRIVDENGRTTDSCEDGEYTVFWGDESLLWMLTGARNTNSVWSKVFKASFIGGIFFEVGKNIHEDYYFMCQCYLREPIHIRRNVPVYQYNVRKNSSSRQAFSDKYLVMLDFCDKKKELISAKYPQHLDDVHNMEVRTYLQMLDLLCRTKDKKYKPLQKKCVKTVRRLYSYHKPINAHHKKLAWIVKCGLYPVYKIAVRIKYHR